MIRLLVRREIDEMHEHGAALDVPQKLVAEAVSFVCAFDETRNIGNDECLLVIRFDDAEVRDERGEWIVGDFRFGGADHRDQRRLAGIRQTDDSHVGDELQLDEQLALFAGQDEGVLDDLRRADPDQLTPIQALALLAELKKRLS